MQSLSESDPGNSYTIKWMFGLPEVLHVLRTYQVREGSIVQVICNSKNRMIIRANNRRLALGHEVTDLIKV